jgi:hypothetical protein
VRPIKIPFPQYSLIKGPLEIKLMWCALNPFIRDSVTVRVFGCSVSVLSVEGFSFSSVVKVFGLFASAEVSPTFVAGPLLRRCLR